MVFSKQLGPSISKLFTTSFYLQQFLLRVIIQVDARKKKNMQQHFLFWCFEYLAFLKFTARFSVSTFFHFKLAEFQQKHREIPNHSLTSRFAESSLPNSTGKKLPASTAIYGNCASLKISASSSLASLTNSLKARL